MMYFQFSKHSLQRRAHYTPRKEVELLRWMRYFEENVDLTELKLNNTYQIRSGGSAVVFKREDERKIFIITFRGFSDFDNREFLNLRLEDKQDKNDRKLLRINLAGRAVACGTFMNSRDNKTLELKRSVILKYKVPTETKVIHYEEVTELDWLIHKDKHGRWILNDFPRREDYVSIKDRFGKKD